MYKILIVDDERREREGLKKLIERYKYPLEVYTAEDGEEALQYLKKMEIDILLTDIKMPFMTGIELIEQVRKGGYTPFCIIFSAYGEFEYAQNAISLGVIQYLLKPILLEDFQKLFDKVCALCEEKYRVLEENKHHQEEEKTQKTIKSFRSFLLYLESGFLSEEEKAELEKPFSDKKYRLFAVLSYSFLFSFRWKDFKEDIKRILGEDVVIVNMDDSQILLLLPEEKECREKHIKEYCESLIKVSKDSYQSDILIIAGPVCKGLDKMKKEYEKIREMMDYQFFISESSYILYDSDFVIKKQSDMLPVYFNKILTCGKLKDYAGIKTEFEKVFRYIDDNMGFSSIYIKYNFTDIMKKLCECLHSEEWLVQGIEEIYEAKSLDNIKETILDFVEKAETGEEERCSENRLVAMAKKIVSERYQDISLGVSVIAEELDVTLAYLSTLFKMETGQSLVKYITSYRMEQAKYLLETTNMKIADVAEKSGYLNTSYFISLFKNREGLSPAQYREKKFNHEEA